MMNTEHRGVRVPALGWRWLTPLYDPLLRSMREERFKKALIRQAGIRAGDRVLDLGCGTATLTILARREVPGAIVTGLDGDAGILEQARRKVAASGLAIELIEGNATDPPFSSGSFDRILSSLLFHHLRRDEKRRALASARRLLRPGGELHVADWGEARSLRMRIAFLGVQLFDGFETTSDNVRGRLVPMMREAGFPSVEETRSWNTIFGTLSLYRAA